MKAVAGHALLDLGGEGGDRAVPEGDVADDPAAEDEIVGHLFDGPRQELDLELFGPPAVDLRDVAPDAVDEADLAVGVLDGAGDPGDVADHLVEDGTALDERSRAVIAPLQLGREAPAGLSCQQEELELAQGLELEAGRFAEYATRPGPGCCPE